MPANNARERAVVAGHTGDETAARELLDHQAGSVRAAALGALSRLDALTSDELAAGLGDPDSGVRRRALQIAALDRPKVDNDLVAALLHDGDSAVAEVAAWSCGERPHSPDVVAQLHDIVASHDDPLCREAAVASLGALGDDSSLPFILAALDDVATIRRRAVLALAPYDGPDVDAALKKSLTDKDWQVRQAAEDVGFETS